MASYQDSTASTPQYTWSLLRKTVIKLAQDADRQVKDPEVGELFDWDPAYVMLGQWCEEMGWVSRDLRAHVDRLDALMDQISDDKTAWSDEAIADHPLWSALRHTARETIALMPEEPWATAQNP